MLPRLGFLYLTQPELLRSTGLPLTEGTGGFFSQYVGSIQPGIAFSVMVRQLPLVSWARHVHLGRSPSANTCSVHSIVMLVGAIPGN